MTISGSDMREFTGREGIERAGMFGRALRKTGRPVVLVAVRAELHAGHIALIRAGKRIPRAAVLLATPTLSDASRDLLAAEGVEAVWLYSDSELWPKGLRTTVVPADHGLEPVEELAAELSRVVALIGVVRPSDVMVGEKDYELAVGVQQAVTDLHLGAVVHGVPAVRMPGGLVVSARNVRVEESAREQAVAMSAALTAGAHAAEHGAQVVERVARAVLEGASVSPEYVAVRGRDLGEAPSEGDGRLLIAARVGGVRLIDNCGVPLGIGFKNLDQQG